MSTPGYIRGNFVGLTAFSAKILTNEFAFNKFKIILSLCNYFCIIHVFLTNHVKTLTITDWFMGYFSMVNNSETSKKRTLTKINKKHMKTGGCILQPESMEKPPI